MLHISYHLSTILIFFFFFFSSFFFQAEDGIRDRLVTGVQTCALPIFEDILKRILKSDSDNIEVIASLSEIYSHRGENTEAIELIDSAIEQDSSSLIVKLIKLKLQAKKENSKPEFARSLDDIIHFLVTDEQIGRAHV